MAADRDEDAQLRSAALQNVQSILQARQRAEHELRETKEQLEEEKRILELLNRTGTALSAQLDLQTVVQTVTDAGTELSGAQFGAFFYTVKNPDGGVFTLYALSGAPREAFDGFGHPRNTAIFAPTFHGEGVVRIADVKEDPRYGTMAPHHGMPPGHLPVRSYLAAPVIGRQGEVLGGLFFGHGDRGVFTERAERLIVGLAAQAAIAIDNARLYEDARRAAEERARLLDAERAARREVERVSLIKDEFLATLSHELRTPLTSVLGWAGLLLARAQDDEELRRGLETIARNARAQARLIEDLLDMSRIVSGKIRLDVQRMDLVPAIEAALESVRPSIEAKAIRVRKTLDPLAGAVFGDPNRLQQVVWNLLTNAVKFTPRAGTIDLILARVSSHVEITVHDSGAGIEPEFLPHLFERFRQADGSTTRRHGGLGLGLSIVKQLVELHGGSVRGESEGEGKGATFVVALPLRAVREPSAGSREHPAGGASRGVEPIEVSLRGIGVLVVDDEPDARDLLRAVLQQAHAQVWTAGSADDALEVLRRGGAGVHDVQVDVIISDIGMPGRDGYEMIRAVRAMEGAVARTPAIALTAFARTEDRTRAMLAGYQAHLSKPIEPLELVAAVRSLAVHRPP